MLVNASPSTTIGYQAESHSVVIIDQTQLPHAFISVELSTLDGFCHAISSMQVRGAPLIGVTAAYGFAFALMDGASDTQVDDAYHALLSTRPTAVNLRWALDRIRALVTPLDPGKRGEAALAEAHAIRQQDIEICEEIGRNGERVIRDYAQHKRPGEPINILTHCNAGWLATVDWGTALAPIYKAHLAGIPVHVWVDETRPRNQGASLTAWELRHQGVPHTVVADNCAGHLMQTGQVDMCIVGSDRTTSTGDVCNKIGTYSKALAAADNGVDFFVALPESTIDWQLTDGVKQIPIEQRDGRELTHIVGLNSEGDRQEVELISGSAVANYAFDVTPAKLVRALITEHGVHTPAQLADLKRDLDDKSRVA